MQESIREKDADEIATAVAGSGRASAFAEIREMLKRQRADYGPGTVRQKVVEKSLESLDALEKLSGDKRSLFVPKRSLPLAVKHRLDGFPCPACGRTLSSVLAGGVVCQNGHRQS
jgi:hypothetical protein